ncbi:MAG: phage tail sheath family protein [Marmoricola sp.]
MPQYLAPGVYVEEIPGPRTIAGVSTSTAAFIGPCRYGPTSGRPELLTSYLDFTRIYGDAVNLEFDAELPNYLALGVKGFFDEGGSSLYVVRTFNYTSDPTDLTKTDDHAQSDTANSLNDANGGAAGGGPALTVRARFPGLAGRLRLTCTLRVGNNVLVGATGTKALTRVHEYDLVWCKSDGATRVVRRHVGTGALEVRDAAGTALDLQAAADEEIRLLTIVVEVEKPTVNSQGLTAFGPRTTVGEFGFDPRANGTGVTTVLTKNPPTRTQALTVPVALEGADLLGAASEDENPIKIAEVIFGTTIIATASNQATEAEKRQVQIVLAGGSDGKAPESTTYEGDPGFKDYQSNPTDLQFNGLRAIETIDDISIVAAPGASSGWIDPGNANDVAQAAQALNNTVVAHCERLPYLTAAIDTPAQLLPTTALDFRNLRSSTHAALYYPWITVPHPVDNSRIDVPPAAYMAGIWARTDNNRGVIKAPANEVVRSALDFEVRLNKAQQELLNPQGVNCLRFFPGPGFLVWGARTISEDPEWKYLSIRRYFNYLEKSVDEGTRWAVFEVNGPALWAAVRHTIEGFLLNEWRSGALLGAKPEQGFFVRCDASTMTSDDLDLGRLVCVIGVAAAKPAEFVIFRISQMTSPTSS